MEVFTVLGFMGEANSGKDFCASWVIEEKNFVRVSFADPIKRFCHKVLGFSTESLWGDSSLRNVPVVPFQDPNQTTITDPLARYSEQWNRAYKELTLHSDNFVFEIPLTVVERAEYKNVLRRWFAELRDRAQEGQISPRVALQLLGTEYGRNFKQSIWVDYLYESVQPAIRDLGRVYDYRHGILHQEYPLGQKPQGIIIPDHRFHNELKLSQRHGGYVIKLVRLSQAGKENAAEKWGIQGHASEAEQRSIPEEDYDLVLELKDGKENVYPRLEKVFEEKEWEKKRIKEYRAAVKTVKFTDAAGTFGDKVTVQSDEDKSTEQDH